MDYLLGPDVIMFTVPAMVGSGFFVIRLAMSLIAGDAFGDDAGGDAGGFDDAGLVGDLDTGLDAVEGGALGDGGLHDAAHADSTSVFKFLSIQAITAFAMGFGWGGFAGVRSLGLGKVESAAVGALFGLLFVWFMTWLLRKMYGLQSHGNISARDAVGREGEVYVGLPSDGGAGGQVRVVVRGRQRIYTARTAGGAIPRGGRIRVLKVNPDNTLLVAKA